MARSPYDVLGIARSADDAAVTKAYRRLAKQYHPDLHPGDKVAEERFKEVSAAYDILGDETKRARFDRGEIDEQGRDRGFAGGFTRSSAQRRTARPGAAGQGGFAGSGLSMDDILGELFGQRGAAAGPTRATAGSTVAGEDVRLTLEVELKDVALGAVRRIALPDREAVDVTIPAGIESGQVLRLKGKGQAGPFGGPAGDALVEIRIQDDPRFRRDGLDVASDAPLALATAVLGGKLRVATLEGEVTLTVPKGSSSGRLLRLRGKGLRDAKSGKVGDQLVRLMIELPESDAALESWARQRATVAA